MKPNNSSAGSSRPLVSVIILNWNQPDYTVACVKSVLTQQLSAGEFEVFLVDNGSNDDSYLRFKKEFGSNKKITIIETGKNLGYTGGNNIAAKQTRGKYIVILNNDTEVEPGWLEALVRVIQSDEKIGAVNSYEIRAGKKVPLETYAAYEFPLNVLQYGVKVLRKKKLDVKKLKKGMPVEVSAIKGCSFIYRKELAPVPFDDDYFIYAEETKLSWLLRSRGYKIMLAPTSIVNHYHNVVRKSNKEFSKFAVYLGERNRLMNLLTFYQWGTTLKMLPLFKLQSLASNIIQWRKIPYRFKAYWYIMTHLKMVWKKRKEIQSARSVPDKALLEHAWRLYPRAAAEFD
ncbi:MAG: glycosyltransferase family 2 protein [Candidatus Woesearchaeota archaeon]|nr:glycosyltransferase family 2 protein [Candidatus Woesearchaeota archaeon]